jgi:hypothetical protein
VSSKESSSLLISDAASSLSLAGFGKLPTLWNIKRMIRKARKYELPTCPTSVEELILPYEYTITEKGERFLLYDSGQNVNRIIIFATDKGIDMLKSAKNWFADGTFKTVPLLFEQLYTIHCIKNNYSFPCVYALLCNKKKETYTRLIKKLKEFIPDYSPSSILTDFELSMIQAIKREFPVAENKGCFFHFSQCIWRKIQSSGLKIDYEANSEVALKFKMLAAIAFVPLDYVVIAFEALMDSQIFGDDVTEVTDYFEDVWIGRPDRRLVRRQPVYSHSMWNCYSQVLNEEPKTNNNIEGWHRGFYELISGFHPNIWKFINGIRKDESLNEMRREQFISGMQGEPQRRKYKNRAERLKQAVSNWNDNGDVLEYLRGISHNISY